MKHSGCVILRRYVYNRYHITTSYERSIWVDLFHYYNIRDEVRCLSSITTYNLSYLITMIVYSESMVITLYRASIIWVPYQIKYNEYRNTTYTLLGSIVISNTILVEILGIDYLWLEYRLNPIIIDNSWDYSPYG